MQVGAVSEGMFPVRAAVADYQTGSDLLLGGVGLNVPASRLTPRAAADRL